MENPFIVLKFGGTSVASASKWAEIALQAKRVLASKRRCWLAVSAVSGTTNLLEKSLKEAVVDTGKDFPADSVPNEDVSFDSFKQLASYNEIVRIHKELWDELNLGDEYNGEYQKADGSIE